MSPVRQIICPLAYWRRSAPHLGLLKLEALTPLIVQRFYNDLLHPEKEDSRPLPPKTIKNIHGVFYKVLQQAVQLGI